MASTYIALDPIRHDGVDYAPGAPIDLDDQAAAALLAAGAIVEAPPRAPVVPIGAKAAKAAPAK